jgi:hypothetical protein
LDLTVPKQYSIKFAENWSFEFKFLSNNSAAKHNSIEIAPLLALQNNLFYVNLDLRCAAFTEQIVNSISVNSYTTIEICDLTCTGKLCEINHISNLLYKCKKLNSLSLTRFQQYTTDDYLELIPTDNTMYRLITKCVNFTVDYMVNIVNKCKTLKVVQLRDVNLPASVSNAQLDLFLNSGERKIAFQ